MLYPSDHRADSRPANEPAKNKQAHMRTTLDFFLSFSQNMPVMNNKQAIKPETTE